MSKDSRFTIISLDLATVTGCGFWAHGMDKPRSLRWEFPRGVEWNGRAYRNLYENLWTVHGIVGKDLPIKAIYFERPMTPMHGQGTMNIQGITRLMGLVAVAELFADVVGANCMEVNVSSW